VASIYIVYLIGIKSLLLPGSSTALIRAMEVNKEEALRCLSIAQKHRNGANLTSALKFAKKSVSLYSTPEGNAMVTIVEREISISTSSSSTQNGSAAASSGTSTPQAQGKASGVEEHVTSAHQRPGHKSAPGGANAEASGSGSGSKKREYTPKQMEVVKRVKSCQHHEYYKILAGTWIFLRWQTLSNRHYL
jgi:DnaJ family protein B protein 12